MYNDQDLITFPYFQKLLENGESPFIRDSLTGVVARPYILQFTEDLIQRQTPFSLALIDLDNFKNINDQYGHKTGDAVLAAVAADLQAFLGRDGVVGRFGGDEFIAVLPNLVDYDQMHDYLALMYGSGRVFRRNKAIGEVKPFITATVGSAAFPKDAQDGSTLFSLIDKALYRGKSKGRNCFIIYLASKHAHLEIPKLAKSSLYSTLRQSNEAFDRPGTLVEKLRAAFLSIQGNLRLHKLFWIDSQNALIDVDTGRTLGYFPGVGTLMSQGMYPAMDFSHLVKQFPDLCVELKDHGMESALFMQVGSEAQALGFLVACPEIHTMHIWQDEECSAVYILARALANELLINRGVS